VSAANNDFDSGDSGDLKASYITVVRASFGLSASGAVTKFPRVTSLAGLDEGLLSFCLPILILYGDSLLEEQILVTNDSAPSYTHRPSSPSRRICSLSRRTRSGGRGWC
jgi:hypothetical protein